MFTVFGACSTGIWLYGVPRRFQPPFRLIIESRKPDSRILLPQDALDAPCAKGREIGRALADANSTGSDSSTE